MALGLSYGNGTGDYNDIVKYNAKAGRMLRVDRNGQEKTEHDITPIFAAIFDMENIKVGWMQFDPAPDFRLVPLGQDIGEQPAGKYKQGAQVMLKLSQECGGDTRELSVVSGIALGSIDALHTQYMEAPEKAQGLLPVVALAGVEGVKGQHGTNYRPTFVIQGWQPRSAFDGDAAATAQPEAQPAQQATPQAEPQAAPQRAEGSVAPPASNGASVTPASF